GRLDCPVTGVFGVFGGGAWKDEEAGEGLIGGVGNVRGRPAQLVEVSRPERGLDLLVLRRPREWPHDLDPASVNAGLDEVQLVEGVVAVLLVPQVPGDGIEGHPEAVAYAVGEDLLDVRPNLAAES